MLSKYPFTVKQDVSADTRTVTAPQIEQSIGHKSWHVGVGLQLLTEFSGIDWTHLAVRLHFDGVYYVVLSSLMQLG
jgi:hypothetical protein